MNISEFYEDLPKQTSPKTIFITVLKRECKVDAYTARNWVKMRAIPKNPDHREVISRLTGIPVEELFKK